MPYEAKPLFPPKLSAVKLDVLRIVNMKIAVMDFSTLTPCETVGCLCEPVRRIRVRASAGGAARRQHFDGNLVLR